MFLNSQAMLRLHNALTCAGKPTPPEREFAEREIHALRLELTYPQLLFALIQKHDEPGELRLRAAIELKLWLQRYRNLEEFEVQHLEATINQVKKNIILYFVTCEQKVASQLLDGITALAAKDYFRRWSTLPAELKGAATGSYQRVLRAVKVVKRVTARYSYQLRSDPLYEQIIFSCNELHDWFFSVTNEVYTASLTTSDPLVYKTLKNLMRVFYQLNYQDLHPHFEDHLGAWMELLTKTMRLSREVPGYSLLKLKGETMSGIILFASKYRDDVQPLINQFTNQIWQLCCSFKGDSSNEKIINTGLKFFRNLSHWSDMRPFFEQNLAGIIEQLVLPQLAPNKRQLEAFSDEPDNFFEQMFLRGDITSTRSAAVDFLQALTKNFKPRAYYENAVSALAAQISAGSPPPVASQVTTLNVLTDGLNYLFRGEEGCVQTNIEGDAIVTQAYLTVVRPTFNSLFSFLNGDKKLSDLVPPFYFSFYLRFVFVFRNYIPKEDLLAVIGLVSLVLKSAEGQFRLMCVAVIDALLSTKAGDFKKYNNQTYYFQKGQHKTLLEACGQVLVLAQTEPLNRHINKILKTLIDILEVESQHYFGPFCQLFKVLILKLSTYEFDRAYEVFDALGAMLKFVLPSRKDLLPCFEGAFLPTFTKLLEKGNDLVNFVFQVFAIVVQNSETLPQFCNAMLTSVFQLSNWSQQNSSLFLSYIAFIRAYARRVPELYLRSCDKLQLILRRLAELGKDRSLFELISNVLSSNQFAALVGSGWFNFCVQLAVSHYREVGTTQSVSDSKHKTTRPAINKYLVVMVCSLLLKADPNLVLLEADKVQPGAFIELLRKQKYMIETIQREERKTIFMGIARLLFQFETAHALPDAVWAELLSAVLENVMSKRLIWMSLKEEPDNSEDQSFKRLKSLSPGEGGPREDEERYLVELYNMCYGRVSGVKNIGALLAEKYQVGLSQLVANKSR